MYRAGCAHRIAGIGVQHYVLSVNPSIEPLGLGSVASLPASVAYGELMSPRYHVRVRQGVFVGSCWRGVLYRPCLAW
jgi:hypothetical protein